MFWSRSPGTRHSRTLGYHMAHLAFTSYLEKGRKGLKQVTAEAPPSSSDILGDDAFENWVADGLLGGGRRKTALKVLTFAGVEGGTEQVG